MVFQEFVCNLSQVMCYKSNMFFFGGFGNDCLLVGNALVMETAWTSKTLVTSLHVATTQKTGIFFPTAVKTLNPTYQFRARNKLYLCLQCKRQTSPLTEAECLNKMISKSILIAFPYVTSAYMTSYRDYFSLA